MNIKRHRHIFKGQVQGVGFRPFVYSIACKHSLSGFVGNTPQGVALELQGDAENLEAFVHDFYENLPPLARVTTHDRQEIAPLKDEKGFSITASTGGEGHDVLISPDVCICDDCLAEILNPSDRRYLYPFTNCTNCGPRYSITRSIPYDRPATTMACFPMCDKCKEEYENPANRRFHAQPNCCPECGPRVWLARKGEDTAFPGLVQGQKALQAVAQNLAQGEIAAIKGLGGFNLACDALNTESVQRLRGLKSRPHKPFAVMVRNLDTARAIALVGQAEERLLKSPEHPIVLCPGLQNSPLSPACSPDTNLIGLMLPYTPLHEALFHHYEKATQGPAVLVMTSGNLGGCPICLSNREALDALSGMADVFLLHDRDILIRVDDSVVAALPDESALFFRRARGYVPRPVSLGEGNQREAHTTHANTSPINRKLIEKHSKSVRRVNKKSSVLGVGAELKNTICLTKNNEAFVSQHIGDMGNMETAAFHRSMVYHLADLLRVQPEVVVRDLHPDFLSSRFAEETGLPTLTLQHHYAHAYAVLAEHKFLEAEGGPPALVLALDGTGLGMDGSLWGGEAIYVDALNKSGPVHKRFGHLAQIPLPGGDMAVREPWRIAHAALEAAGLDLKGMDLPWLPHRREEAQIVSQMAAKSINTPQSSSCGRLFDAVAAILGLCESTSYEGQPAIRLEEAQTGTPPEDAGFSLPLLPPQSDDGCYILDSLAMLKQILEDKQSGRPVAEIARDFHSGLARGLTEISAVLAEKTGTRHVGLSGGCLQNRTLIALLSKNLIQRGLIPLVHKELPPNDGCIALGQAAWGHLTVK